MLELLTTAEMGEADRLTIAGGIPGMILMEAAGRAVAQEVVWRWPDAAHVAVLCGPGNNGGDGFVAARHLKAQGFSVSLALLGARDRLTGDAAAMAERWDGEVAPLTAQAADGASVVIDALFGAGLTRPLEGAAADLVETVTANGQPVVAVDVPSGIDGTSGAVKGTAFRAAATVTFFRRKPGHLLLPGRLHCGAVRVAEIGIKDPVLQTIAPQTFANAPGLWLGAYPWPSLGGHKYDRGHAIVVSGGPEQTGAARLAARGALRAGAGLVTLVGSPAATAVNAAHMTAVMTRSLAGPEALDALLKDERLNAVLVGPGAGVDEDTREMVLAAAQSPAALLLDADALTAFEETPETLFAALESRKAPAVLTPHDGEFARLFGADAGAGTDGSKLDRARRAAALSGAHIVLKGADTVVAGPDGRAAINENAPAWLATAGAGDVLGGMILALLAQGMPPFEGCCAGVWLHGEAAARFGPGLIAEDLPEMLPQVIDSL